VRTHDEESAFSELQSFRGGKNRGKQAEAVLFWQHLAKLDKFFQASLNYQIISIPNKQSLGQGLVTLLFVNLP
jgi:hypothetical protein